MPARAVHRGRDVPIETLTNSVVRLRNALSALQAAGLEHELANLLDPDDLEFLNFDWPSVARADQTPPESDDWTTWLLLGGRGAGKTRAGAEWVKDCVQFGETATAGPARIALIGETLTDVRSVMIEGPSGLLAIHPRWRRPKFEPSLRRLTWPNGAIAEMFSAEQPDSLRGPQFSAAWADELCKWRYADETWNMLQFGLRLGRRPRQVVTTTPRPIPLLKRLMANERTKVSRASTRANAKYLAPAFLEAILADYEGTRLGRQEIDGEIVDDNPNALWSREIIERHRVRTAPDLARIVVGVDPPVTSGPAADACGIVVAGRGGDGRIYVLRDATASALTPLGWSARAVAVYRAADADLIVAEVNQGGDLVTTLLHQTDPDVPVRQVRASRGKWLRAEPVAALYERGQVAHVGAWPELEDEMCEFEPGGFAGAGRRSPDRLDALVWALTELMDRGAPPRVRTM